MTDTSSPILLKLIDQNFDSLLTDWVQDQTRVSRGTVSEADVRGQCSELLNGIRKALIGGAGDDIQGPLWASVRDLLTQISSSRAILGATPSETATFVLSLKAALFSLIRTAAGKDSEALGRDMRAANMLLDRLALFTTDVFLHTREDVIKRQQQDMLELSTPVVKLWDGVLALPMIGTLDSTRTQVVMETLLQRIVETGADVAILDITGVPTVDTLTAQHLLKTVTAARLMGAECIISGIRPQIAQTIVHLGIDLGDVITRATLADAFKVALSRMNLAVTKSKPAVPAMDN